MVQRIQPSPRTATHRMRPPQRRSAALGQPDVRELALLLELDERPDLVLDGDVPVDPRRLEEVDRLLAA